MVSSVRSVSSISYDGKVYTVSEVVYLFCDDDFDPSEGDQSEAELFSCLFHLSERVFERRIHG